MKQKKSLYSSHRRWFYVFVPIASSIFTLVTVELALVVFHPVPASIESNMYFVADEFTGYRLKPNSKGYYQNKIAADANAQGHRDNPVTLVKPRGTYRILVLGDSFTAGANVTQESAYPQVLESLFTTNNKSHVEVINTGVGGWSPFQYAQYYQHYGRNFSPDLILVGFFVGNDTYTNADSLSQTHTATLGRRVSREALSEHFIQSKVFFYNNSNIARLLFTKGPTKRDFTRVDCSSFTDHYLDVQTSLLPNHLKLSDDRRKFARNSIAQITRVYELAKQDNIPIVVILIPDENQINESLKKRVFDEREQHRFDFFMPQSMLIDSFENASISVIDLLPTFKNNQGCHYMNDTHWNTEAHKLAAQTIYANVKKYVH